MVKINAAATNLLKAYKAKINMLSDEGEQLAHVINKIDDGRNCLATSMAEALMYANYAGNLHYKSIAAYLTAYHKNLTTPKDPLFDDRYNYADRIATILERLK